MLCSCRKAIAASEPDALQIAKNHLGRNNIRVHAYAAVSTCQRRHDTLPPFFDSLATPAEKSLLRANLMHCRSQKMTWAGRTFLCTRMQLSRHAKGVMTLCLRSLTLWRRCFSSDLVPGFQKGHQALLQKSHCCERT